MKTPECPIKSLSLDEAIAHADEVAGNCDTACRREHKQLADWLRELKARRSAERGDCAKLREAIAKCVNLITEFGDAEIVKTPLDVIVDIEAILNTALSAPPRNCDRFATVGEARKAHEEYRKDYIMRASNKFDFPMEFEAWLFAPATEQEGGAK